MTDAHLGGTHSPSVQAAANGSDPLLAIDRLVHDLNALCKATTLHFTIAVGELVIRTIYAGDLSRFRSRERKNRIALRKVARHPDLVMSATMLYRCLATFELCERLGIRSWKHVSTSHLRLVLPLEPGEQARLLQEADANRWPVRRLEQEVAAVADGHPAPRHRGGRRRRSPLRDAVDALDTHLDTIAGIVDSCAQNGDLSALDSRALLDRLRRIADICRTIEKHVV